MNNNPKIEQGYRVQTPNETAAKTHEEGMGGDYKGGAGSQKISREEYSLLERRETK